MDAILRHFLICDLIGSAQRRLALLLTAIGFALAFLHAAPAFAAPVKLQVNIQGTPGLGTTTVTSTPAGLNCAIASGSCTDTYFESGTIVTLKTVGAAGVTPTNWSSGSGAECTMVAGDPAWGPRDCRITLTTDTALTVTSFPERTLTVVARGIGALVGVAYDPRWSTRPTDSTTASLFDFGDVCGSPAPVAPGAMPSPQPICWLFKVPSAYPVRVSLLTSSPGAPAFSGWDDPSCTGTDPCSVGLADGNKTLEARFGTPAKQPDWCKPAQNFDYYDALINNDPAGLGCNLSARDLTGANFSGSKLSGPNLGGTRPVRVCLDGSTLRNANFRNTRGAYFGTSGDGCWGGADLSGADLTGADSFSGGWTVIGAQDQRGGLPKYDGTTFGDVAQMAAIVNGADLSRARFAGKVPLILRISQLFGPPVAFNAKKLPSSWDVACDDKSTDTSCIVLRPRWSIEDAQKAADEATSSLNWPRIIVTSVFRGADLSGANLAESNLAGADLTSATTTSSSTSKGARTAAAGKANLRNVSLTGAQLNKADLKGAVLAGVRSGKVKGKAKSLPKGWVLVKGYLVGPGANLDQAQLRGADLRRASLKGVSLAGARLDGAKLGGKSYPGIKGKPKKLPAGWKLVGKTLKRR